MLREQTIQRLLNLRARNGESKITECMSSKQRYRFAISGESEQELALNIIQLRYINFIQQIARHVTSPDMLIALIVTKCCQCQLAVAQPRGQQRQGKDMTTTALNNRAQGYIISLNAEFAQESNAFLRFQTPDRI